MSKRQVNFVVVGIISLLGCGNLEPKSKLTDTGNSGCNKSNIFSVDAPIASREPEAGTFKYYYQHIKKAPDSSPTIVFIPGGPGGTAIDQLPENPFFDFTQMLLGLPKSYNAILTDPRTAGCNRNSQTLPKESFTTENVANDIASVINHLQLENYVLAGHSYGTVVATHLGKMAEDGIIPRPRSIVLSGTPGRYFVNHEETVRPAYYKIWANLRSHLPQTLQDQFPKNNDWSDYYDKWNQPLLLGQTAAAWFGFIFSNLQEGGVYLNGKLSYPFLDKLALINSSDAASQGSLKSEVAAHEPSEASANSSATKLKPFHDAIWCTELEEFQSDECKAQNLSFSNPYDSKSFQMGQTPLIYLHGEFDPAVPIELAYYHYINQTGDKKYFLVAKDGGHSNTAAISDCRDSFWTSASLGASDIHQSVSSCIGIKIIEPK